jgi:dipeptidyl aminopeptidase/acylaminoacyl peptidase
MRDLPHKGEIMTASRLRALSALIVSVATVMGAFAHAQGLPASAFARLPGTQGVSISPDGSRLAFVTHEGEARYVVVMDLETGHQEAADFSTMRAYSTFWADEDTLLARAGRTREFGAVSGDVNFQALVSIDADTLEADQLIREGRDLGYNFNTAAVAGVDPQTGRLFMPLRDTSGALNLYAVDPENGRRMTLVARGNENTHYWIASPDGQTYVRVSYNNSLNQYQIAVEDNDQWRTLYEARQTLVEMSVAGFTADGEALLINRYGEGARRISGLQRLSLADGSWGEVYYQDAQFDLGGVRTDPHRGYVAGVTITAERTRTEWFDEELAALQANLDQSFGGAVVTLADWTPDRMTFVIAVSEADAPVVYYLVDLASWNVTPLRARYPELYGQPLPARQPVQYPARDGVSIPAYLAQPEGEGPHPYVLLVHGGPASRDSDGFDYFAHFLASRGYGVLQPQYRGSSGFGEDWVEAGYGQWGRGVMQHDLTDAVAWLREQGLADRICIAGGSYGGYAALAGAAFTPDLYECAIAINALSDAGDFLNYIDNRAGRESQAFRYWNQHFSGEPDGRASGEQLRALSPAHHADSVQASVLLLHSRDDTVVPEEQSRIMERALNRAGKDVEFVRLQGGDHSLEDYPTRLAVLEAMAEFLDAELGD